MKNRVVILSVVFCCSIGALFGNPSNLETKEDSVVNYMQYLSEEEKELPVVILKDYRKLRYTNGFNNQTFLKSTTHKVVYVNDDKAVEEFNKVYIPVGTKADLYSLNAKSISASGEVKEFDKENIKELENVEGAGNYLIFAIEGAEKKGVIEYEYTIKEEEDYFGREFYQQDIPVKNATFELSVPDHLNFKVKSYNNFGKVVKRTKDDRIIYRIKVDEIEPLLEEEYSLFRNNLMRVEYKLRSNSTLGEAGENMMGYDLAANRIRRSLVSRTSKETKKVKKQLKSIGVFNIENEELRIAMIDKHIINNYSIIKSRAQEASTVENILVNKYASEIGIQKLYIAMLKVAEIDFEIALTTNKSYVKFDEDFENWRNLNEVILYFPKYNKSIYPSDFSYTYGLAPIDLTENYALFIPKLGAHKIEKIHVSNKDETLSEIIAHVEFDEKFKQANIKLTRNTTGYQARIRRFLYVNIEAEQKDAYIKEEMMMMGDDAEVEDYTVENGSFDDFYNNTPFSISGNVSVKSLIEKAGKKYLFNIGDIIGPQNEMYEDKNRQMDIEMPFNKTYIRTISFIVPDGYVVKNLEELNMNISLDTRCAFESSYKRAGNKVTVYCTEYYDRLNIPKKDYEQFRAVINAAADFNKITLLFEPKK